MEIYLIVVLILFFCYFLYKKHEYSKTEKTFLKIVNHTFRTPLTGIKWMGEALQKEITREDREKYAHDISNASNRLLDIVDIFTGIKDIGDQSSYDFKAVSIREIIEHSLAKYGAQIKSKNITLEIPTFTNIPMLTLDVKKISLVIDVLLENAIVYTEESGKIKIACKIEGRNLILAVVDNGIGLTWRNRGNIFEKFYKGKLAQTMNPNGMGLGLYLSKEIIRRHKGRIWAKSGGRNKGSIFFIKLPLA